MVCWLSFKKKNCVYFLCVRVCVYLCMYVRSYLAIPCVSSDDDVKHTKSNIRYDKKINTKTNFQNGFAENLYSGNFETIL